MSKPNPTDLHNPNTVFRPDQPALEQVQREVWTQCPRWNVQRDSYRRGFRAISPNWNKDGICGGLNTNDCPSVCGDGNLAVDEECETDDDCSEGYACNNCVCEEIPSEIGCCHYGEGENAFLISGTSFKASLTMSSLGLSTFSSSLTVSLASTW